MDREEKEEIRAKKNYNKGLDVVDRIYNKIRNGKKLGAKEKRFLIRNIMNDTQRMAERYSDFEQYDRKRKLKDVS